MLANYFPILIFTLVGLVMGVVLIALGFGLGKLLGHARADSEKQSPYECGFEAFEDSRMKFDVRYYLVAILFIIFDLEIAFLSLGSALEEYWHGRIWAMMIFLGAVGWFYLRMEAKARSIGSN